MEWTNLLSTKRLGAQDSRPERLGRTEFESDFDRIIFSSAFRRLGKKTQVHPLAANDHVHTRLTHSLEVSRVGNALGKILGERLRKDPGKYQPDLPANITPHDLGAVVQAACLAHDLGNPPFGHAGEAAIIHWFEQNQSSVPENLQQDFKHDLKSLEGNAQGFRILTQLENHIFTGGFQLTYATLGAFQKYPWTSREREKKFGSYVSEEKILNSIFEELKIPRKGDGTWARHPLAYLVEAADDICYAIIDLEDAVEIGILKFSEATEVLLCVVDGELREKLQSEFRTNRHRVNFSRMRGPIFETIVAGAVDGFLMNYDLIMTGTYTGSLFESLGQDDPRRTLIKIAKDLARDSIFSDPKKVEMEIGCYATFDTLLSEFCRAALDQADVLSDKKKELVLPWKSQRVLQLLGDHAPAQENGPEGGWSHYQCLRRVIDYVSGMTDNYATYIAKQMQGGGFSGGQRP